MYSIFNNMLSYPITVLCCFQTPLLLILVLLILVLLILVLLSKRFHILNNITTIFTCVA